MRAERAIVAAHADLGVAAERVPLLSVRPRCLAAMLPGQSPSIGRGLLDAGALARRCRPALSAPRSSGAAGSAALGYLDPIGAGNATPRLRGCPHGCDVALCRTTPGTPAANGASASPANAAEAIALDELIAAHQATHGDFADTAAIARALKAVLDVAAARLGAVQREALGQIAVKLAPRFGRVCLARRARSRRIAIPVWRSERRCGQTARGDRKMPGKKDGSAAKAADPRL